MKHSKEFLAVMFTFLFLITVLNFVGIRYALSHFKMKGDTFSQVGMMEYVNPADGKKLYFLMYTKGDK